MTCISSFSPHLCGYFTLGRSFEQLFSKNRFPGMGVMGEKTLSFTVCTALYIDNFICSTWGLQELELLYLCYRWGSQGSEMLSELLKSNRTKEGSQDSVQKWPEHRQHTQACYSPSTHRVESILQHLHFQSLTSPPSPRGQSLNQKSGYQGSPCRLCMAGAVLNTVLKAKLN